jgi:hypothetical protein
MTKSSTSLSPNPIKATGRYEAILPVEGGDCWVFCPDGSPFVASDVTTAEHIAATLNKDEFGCECSSSCSGNCKCK